MAEGTNVGSVFLDLIVRDTVKEQVQKMAAKGQETAKQAFSGVEKAAEKMAETVSAQTGKAAQKAAQTAARASQQASAGINKSVAMAQAKVKELERAFDAVTAKLDTQWNAGTFDPNKKATSSLLAQQEKLMAQIEAARERLRIHVQIAAQKQAAAESAAAQKAAAAEEKAANRRKAIHASLWKNMLSRAGDGAKSMLGKLAGITKGYNRSGGAARRFGSRLREIASGALIFNGISMALRSMVNYFSRSIASTEGMRQALANLKGAAANAASPLIQVLTPALTALANAAATALSYVARLVTLLTGKISNAAATANKSAQSAAGAAQKASRSLAGFDQIERLGGNSSGGGGSGETAPNYNFEGKSPFLEAILSSIQAGQWGQVGALIAQKLNESLAAVPWPAIHSKVQKWTQNLVDTLNGLGTNVNWGLIGSSIGNGLNSVIIAADTFLSGVKWSDLGKGLGEGFTKCFQTIKWKDLASGISSGLTGIFDGITAFLANTEWKDLGNKIAEFLKEIKWGEIADSLFRSIGAALGSLAELLWGLIEEAWNSMMEKWLQNTEKCGGDVGAGLLLSILEGLGDLHLWLYEHLIQPFVDGILEAFGIDSQQTHAFVEAGENVMLGLLQGLSESWNKVVQWANKGFKKITKLWEDAPEWFRKNIIKPIADFFTQLWKDVSQFFADGWAKAQEIWDDAASWFDTNVIRPVREFFSQLWEKISGFCSNAWSKAQQTWQKAASWFDSKVIQPVASFFSKLWEDVSGFCSDCWAGMQETWKSVSDWFQKNVVKPITDAFQSVYDGVSDIWNGLVGVIKGAINGIIGFINGMLRSIVDGINGVTEALNKISLKLPEWLEYVPGARQLAGQEIGFNIPPVTAPQIPLLANGGVIQQPTLAMMGEYAGARNNPEIVTPQSLMAETVAGVMEDVIASNVAGFEAVVSVLREILEAVLGIEIGDEVIGQAVARYNRKMAVVKGGG